MFALLGAITYHHYETVYGSATAAWRRRGWVELGGRLGRPARGAVVLLVAGALPAGFWILAALLGVLFVTKAVAEWRRFQRRRAAGL